MKDIPFFLEQNEQVEKSYPALFYGETTVMSTWGTGIGTGFGGGILGGGLSTSTANKTETAQGLGTLFLTNMRLVFVSDKKQVKFSIPLQTLQSVNYCEKFIGLHKCMGVSFMAAAATQTASFCFIGGTRAVTAEDWIQTIKMSVQRIRQIAAQPENQPAVSSGSMKFCNECGKQIRSDVKFCEFCGTKSNT